MEGETSSERRGETLSLRVQQGKEVKIDVEGARNRHRVTCGADIIIKNVLPFLELPEGDDGMACS